MSCDCMLTIINKASRCIAGDYETVQLLLSHNSIAVCAKTCGMMGNLLKKSVAFYPALKK
jgi:hypothetical protein